MSYGYNNNGRTFRQGPGFVESEYISPDGSSYEFEQFKKTDNVEDYVHESYHQSSPRNNYHVPAIGFGGSFGGGLGHTSPLGGLGHTSPRPISPSYGASSFDRSPRGSPNDFSNHAILRLDQLRQEAEARINELRQRANDAFARMRNQSQYPVQDFAYPPLPSPRPFDGRTSPLRQDHTYTNPYSQPSYNPSLSSPSRYSPSNTAPYHSPSSHLPYSSSPTLAPYSSSPSYRPQSSSPHSSSYNPSTYQPYSSPSYRPQTSSPSSYQPHTGYGQGYGAGGGGGGSGLPGYGSYTSGGGYGPSAGSYGYGSPSSYNSYGNKPTKVDTKPSTLKVTVVRANGLREDRYRTIDPYVVLTLDTQRFQTSVKSGSTPFWGESFSFDLNRTAQTLLKVEVIDSTTRDKLGWDWVQLRTAPAGVRVPVQVQLKTGGTLTLELDGGPSSASPYSPGSLNSTNISNTSKPQNVRVTVVQGRNLKSAEWGRKCDAFVVMTLGTQKFQTRMEENKDNPVWEEFFTFDTTKQPQSDLRLEVFDRDLHKKIGWDFVPLTSAQVGQRVQHTVQLPGGGEILLELKGEGVTPGSISPYGGGSSQYPGSSPSRPGNATTPSTKPTSVRVIVDRGIQLKGMDVGSKSDPFVKLSLGKQQTFQTKTKNNTNDPVWGEEFTFDLSREDTTLLKVEVFDKDVLSQNKIGYELLDLKKAKAGQRVDETVTILDPKGNPNGKIVLQLFGTISAPKPTTIKIGVIKASIKKSGDWFGKSDPYVVLTLDKQKYQTQSKNNTQDPVWNEYFTFDMNRSPQTLLHVQLFDKDVIGSSKLADDWVNLGTVRSGQRPTQHIVQIKSGGELILEIGDSSPAGSQVGPGAGIGSSLGGTSPSSRPPYQSTPGSSAPYSSTTPNYGTPSYGGSSPSYGGLGGPTSGGYSSPSYNTYGGSQPGYGAGTSSPSSNYNNAVPFPNSQPSSAYGSPSSRPGGYGSGGSPSGNYGSTTPGSSQLGGPLYSNPPGQGAGSYSPSSSYGAPAKPAASSKPPFVQVRVISADKIKSMDMGSKSDPYVVLTLDKQKFTTKVKNNTLTPEWNETFVFDLSKTAQTLLKVEMYDKDLIGSDKMHSDSILLNTARVGIPKVEQIALQTGGVLYLEVTGLNSPTPISTGSSSPVGGIGSSSPSSNRPPYSGAPAGPTSSPSSSYPPSGAPPSSNSPSSFAPSPASQAPSSRLNQVKPRPQIVKVTVRYARNLPSRISSSVLLSLDQQKYQTKIVPGENPVWNEPFSFDMGKQAQTLLKVSLKNESEIPVRTIGYELVDLKVVALGERAEAEIAIDNNRSSLVLELEGSSSPLAPASTRPSSTVPSSRPQQARTATRVRVGVLQARNLKNTDGWMAGKSDPYVALTLKDQKFQTKVVDNNLNPVWNEYFEFDMTKQDQTLLKLEVFDKDIVGQTKLGEEWVNLKTATFDRPVQSALKLSQGEVIVEIQAIA